MADVNGVQDAAIEVVPYVSLEDKQLNEAIAALEAAKVESAKVEPEVVVDPVKPAEPVAPAVEAKDKQKPPPGFVPVAAVKAERDGKQKAEQEAAYYKGVAEAALLMANKPTQNQQQDDQVTPDQRLAQIREEHLALADQFDNGEISNRKLTEARFELEAEERAIREQSKSQQNAPVNHRDAYVEIEERKLEEQYPILNQVTVDDLRPLVPLAYRDAQREGKPIGTGPLADIELKTRVAKLATALYGSPKTEPKPNQPSPGGVSLSTAQSKAELAATHPIDASSLGSAASAGPMSDAEVMSKLKGMSETEQLKFLDSQPSLVQRVMQRVKS